MAADIKTSDLLRDAVTLGRRHGLQMMPLLVLMVVGMQASYALAFVHLGGALVGGFGIVVGTVLSAVIGVVVYRRCLGQEARIGLFGRTWKLALAQSLIHLLLLILIGFILMFLTILTGLLAGAGGFDPAAASAETMDVDAARAALGRTGQSILGGLVLISAIGLVWLCLRLVLFGVATTDAGQVLIFRTWSWTQGATGRLALVYIVFVIIPPLFLFAFAGLTVPTETMMPVVFTSEASMTGRIIFAVAHIWWFLAGHVLAVVLYEYLLPDGLSDGASGPRL